jgi:hypothetical protein
MSDLTRADRLWHESEASWQAYCAEQAALAKPKRGRGGTVTLGRGKSTKWEPVLRPKPKPDPVPTRLRTSTGRKRTAKGRRKFDKGARIGRPPRAPVPTTITAPLKHAWAMLARREERLIKLLAYNEERKRELFGAMCRAGMTWDQIGNYTRMDRRKMARYARELRQLESEPTT